MSQIASLMRRTMPEKSPSPGLDSTHPRCTEDSAAFANGILFDREGLSLRRAIYLAKKARNDTDLRFVRASRQRTSPSDQHADAICLHYPKGWQPIVAASDDGDEILLPELNQRESDVERRILEHEARLEADATDDDDRELLKRLAVIADARTCQASWVEPSGELRFCVESLEGLSSRARFCSDLCRVGFHRAKERGSKAFDQTFWRDLIRLIGRGASLGEAIDYLGLRKIVADTPVWGPNDDKALARSITEELSPARLRRPDVAAFLGLLATVP